MQFKRNNYQLTVVQFLFTDSFLLSQHVNRYQYETVCVCPKASGSPPPTLLSRLNTEGEGPEARAGRVNSLALLIPFAPCPALTHFATIPTGPAPRRVTWGCAVEMKACLCCFSVSMVLRSGRFWRRSPGAPTWTGESWTLKGVSRQPFREEGWGRNRFRDLIGCLFALGSGDGSGWAGR